MMEKLKQNSFDMNDLLDQMKQVKKLGPIKQIVSMLPGGDKIKEADLEQGDVRMKRTEALIYSMTKEERANPKIITPSRKRRIAAGSGNKVEDVNQLLKQFETMQKMMKQLGGKGGKKKRRGFPLMPKGGMGGMNGMGGGSLPF